MNTIQIRINIHASQQDDALLADAIERIILFVRSLFPEMHPNRMDSPVTVNIVQVEDETE